MSSGRNLRYPLGSFTCEIRPLSAQDRSVFGCTPNRLAASLMVRRLVDRSLIRSTPLTSVRRHPYSSRLSRYWLTVYVDFGRLSTEVGETSPLATGVDSWNFRRQPT